ncbi:hypothetical protein SEPCBS57363_000515 [Sporothrix epigloea]|uniref:Uncharacterized protein n=1 Tax=Sporothrix epigloea TaxID=1892477 RepID=A0ABP0D516_9PEZI
MSLNRPASKVPPRPQAQDINYEEWNEEQLEAALESLRLAHLKLRSLRSTIPTMVQPLTAAPVLPQILHAKVQVSLFAAVQEVGSFRETIANEEFRKITEYAAQSRMRNGNHDIKPWKARDEPEWAN